MDALNRVKKSGSNRWNRDLSIQFGDRIVCLCFAKQRETVFELDEFGLETEDRGDSLTEEVTNGASGLSRKFDATANDIYAMSCDIERPPAHVG